MSNVNPDSLFHDQSVVGFSSRDGKIYLGMECYDEEKKTYIPVPVVFHGVRNIRIDDVPAESVDLLHDDGEMLTFKTAGDQVHIVIQWENYKEKKNEIRSYKFAHDRLDIDGEPVGPAESRP